MKKICRKEWNNILTLACAIALLPPMWAVASSYFGMTTGPVALACAAVYVANGNRAQDGIKISMGFLCGDIWAYFALKVMNIMPLNQNVELFITLFILGALAVVLGNICRKVIYLPSWLGGWAIGLIIMGPVGIASLESLPFQIGISMIIGVWYIGVGVDKFQKILLKFYDR